MKRKPLKEVIQKILDGRRKILLEEATYYEDLSRANANYWGYGNGPCGRQDKAAEKRRQELEEVRQLETQLMKSVILETHRLYYWYCKDCGKLTFTTGYPSGEWHECGSCRKMINQVCLQDLEIQTPTNKHFARLLRRIRTGEWEDE